MIDIIQPFEPVYPFDLNQDLSDAAESYLPFVTVDEFPTAVDDIWMPTFMPIPNWANNVKLACSWLTDVKRAKSLSEDRYSLLSKPYRTISFASITRSQHELRKVYNYIKRIAHARTVIPLYTDCSIITNVSGTKIYCDTSYRRFFADKYVVLVNPTNASFEIGIISSVEAEYIDLVQGASSGITTGCKIYPLMIAHLNPMQSLGALTDIHTTFNLSFSEVEGRTALPVETTEYVGDLVFDLPYDWASVGVDNIRNITTTSSGRGTVIIAYGERSLNGFSLSFTFTSRSSAWDMINFHNHCRGRGKSFWFASPLRVYDAQTINATYIVVKAVDEIIDWYYNPYVGVKHADGSYTFKELDLTTISRNAGYDTIYWKEIGGDFSDAKKITAAYKTRFGSDELGETWINNNCMQANIELVDLLNEYDVDIEIESVI